VQSSPTGQPSEAATSLTAGDVLGAYRLIDEIGRGGMGQVFAAKHRALGKQVAIKVLRERYATDRESLRRFFREARTACAIEHPNIVEISDFIEDERGRAFYVMEYLRGRTLQDRLDMGPLAPPEALPIARQIADALSALHGAEIMHRDLKPANIFLVPSGRPEAGEHVKLLDFGLAKATDLDAPSELATSPNFLLGTPEYMAPEQIKRPQDVDWRADIYAFGTVLFEMLVGERPIVATTPGELLVKLVTTEPPRLAERVDTTPELDTLVARCLDKDPERRPSAAGLLEALDSQTPPISQTPHVAVATAASPAQEVGFERPEKTSEVAAPRSGSRRPLIGALVVVALLTAGLALWAVWPRGGAPAGLARADAGVDGRTRATIATLAELWRSVQHRARERRGWGVARRGLALAHLDALRTGGASRAEIRFRRGGSLEVDEDSEILIEAPRPLVEGGPAIVQVARLRKGVLRARAQPGTPLRVIGRRGATALLRALDGKPARLRLRERADGRLEVAVLGGRARIGEGPKTIALNKSQLVDVRGKRPGAPQALPGMPALVAPAVDAHLPAGAIELRWKAIAGASSYQLAIARGANFRKVIAKQQLANTQLEVTLPAGQYAWRVRAIDADGHRGEYGFARRFRVEPLASTPTTKPQPRPKPRARAPRVRLLTPTRNLRLELIKARESLRCTWTPARHASLVVARHRDLRRGVFVKLPVRGTSVTLQISTPGTFFWGLCPPAGCGPGARPLSAPRRLRVIRRAPPKVDVTPIDWKRGKKAK
jgi:serine/threonine protein kinase